MQTNRQRLDNQKAGMTAPKRIFDVVVASAMLLACLPLFAFTAVAIYFSLGRPLMFTQERAGKLMRRFTISKFRTMTEERDGEGKLLADDKRQTALTWFIRRVRFDELPQLFAVLRGDLSLIGPRPLPLATLQEFGETGRLRCSIPPGMTGWAQVNGNTLLSAEQKMALDIWYVDHRTFWLDILIIFKTAMTVIAGESLNLQKIDAAQQHLASRSLQAQPNFSRY